MAGGTCGRGGWRGRAVVLTEGFLEAIVAMFGVEGDGPRRGFLRWVLVIYVYKEKEDERNIVMDALRQCIYMMANTNHVNLV